MGSRSDKLFNKRKAKGVAALKRSASTFVPRERILVVCEGEVTEVQYLKLFKHFAVLTNIDVEICGEECGSSPISVVNYAEQRANAEGPHNTGGYDRVYCVIDRDNHVDFEKAIGRILDLNKTGSTLLAKTIRTICSFPCFEVWFLFHFAYKRAPFVTKGSRSPCENVARELRKNPAFSSYIKKLDDKQAKVLFENLDFAKSNAILAQVDADSTGEPNPSTQVNQLLVELEKSSEIVHI